MGTAPRKTIPPPDPAIFVLPVRDVFLLHAPLIGVSALINKKALENIARKKQSRGPVRPARGQLGDLLDALKTSTPAAPRQPGGPPDPSFLGLITTRGCSGACVYCDFQPTGGADERMDPRLAAQAVDWFADLTLRKKRSSFDVHFFGGEPLAAVEAVEVAVHRARTVASRAGMKVRFETATSGVFDKSVARFVSDYFDTVVLSFDGREDIHNRNRPLRGQRGSFHRVAQTARILAESSVELCLRMCVTGESVGVMEETVQWFADRFHPAAINFETLKPTLQSLAAGITPPDPCEFAIRYLRSRRILRQRGISAVYAPVTTDGPRRSFCPVGNDAAIVSPDGRISSCYLRKEAWKARGLDLDIGRIGPGGDVRLAPSSVARLRKMVNEKPDCLGCFCRWSCAGGCHVTHSYPGRPPGFGSFCIQTRIITACTILENLGMHSEMENLLADPDAMEKLALAPSDRMEDAIHESL